MKCHTSPAGDLLVLVRGEELLSTLAAYAEARGLTSATVQSGVGGADQVVLSFYDLETKNYVDKTFTEPLEILSLQGNLSLVDGKPFWHVHGLFGQKDYQTIGGHVQELRIALTGELFIIPLKAPLVRTYDETTGLKLIVS